MLKKISFEDAVQLELDGVGYLLHLNWMPGMQEKYPDCSHVVVRYKTRWYTNKHKMAVVLTNEEAEEKYNYKKAQDALRETLRSKGGLDGKSVVKDDR